MKRIAYIAPIDYMRGSISGRQDIEYNGGDAYSITTGDVVSADVYAPRVVVKYSRRDKFRELRYFQVRTRSTINMTAGMRLSLAVMGGAGALFASLVNHKSAQIYADVIELYEHDRAPWETLRQFIVPRLMLGLRYKDEYIDVGAGVTIVNPWISGDPQNVPVTSAIVDKFKDVLS